MTGHFSPSTQNDICEISQARRKFQNVTQHKYFQTLIFPITTHTKPQTQNMNAPCDLQEHCEALFPYSTQRGVAKFVDSAQLNPWLNPAWYPYGKVIMISPASCVIWSTTKKNRKEINSNSKPFSVTEDNMKNTKCTTKLLWRARIKTHPELRNSKLSNPYYVSQKIHFFFFLFLQIRLR